jgi:CRP-like cAMP-binding protein
MKTPISTIADPESLLHAVGEGTSRKAYSKNEVIFTQGDACDHLFFIHSGEVKISVVSEQGKEAVIAIMNAGHFIGEGCLSGQALRISSARAIDDCVISAIEKAVVMNALKTNPEFAAQLLAYLLARNSRIEGDLIDQLFNSSERRLARLLLLLANFGKEGSPDIVAVELSQETLAEMIGTTRSRVSSFMNKFRKLGLISYNGKIHVHQSLLNAVLHEIPAMPLDDKKR